MNKAKKFIWIPIIVIVAIAIAIVTLSLVKVNPLMDNFSDYTNISLYVSYDKNAPEIKEDGVNVTKAAIEEGLKDSSFSYMHAMLEGKYSYGLRLKYDEDGETEKTLTANDITSLAAHEGEYIVKLSYGDGVVKTLKVGGKEIKYDTVIVRLFESNGEVVDVECVPYLSANIGNEIPDDTMNEDGIIGSEYYKTYVVLVKMNTSRAMLNIKEYKEKYQI